MKRTAVWLFLSGSVACTSGTFANIEDWAEAELKVSPARPPGGDYAPGTLIQLDFDGSANVKAEASECFGSLESLVKEDAVAFDSSTVIEFSAGVAAALEGLLPGEDARVTVKDTRIKKLRVRLTGIRRERVSNLQLKRKAETEAFPQDCVGMLKSYHVITEAFKVVGFKMEFTDENGVTIAADVPVSEVVSIEGDAGVAVSNDGTVQVDEPFFVGFRVQQVLPNFPEPGEPTYCCFDSERHCQMANRLELGSDCYCPDGFVGRTCR